MGMRRVEKKTFYRDGIESIITLQLFFNVKKATRVIVKLFPFPIEHICKSILQTISHFSSYIGSAVSQVIS